MQPADAVLKFLDSVGRRSEAKFYLQLFRAEPKERFATLVIDAATLDLGMDAVAVDLRFLRALELTPVVVVGLFRPEGAADNADRLALRLMQGGTPCERVQARDPAPEDAARDAARAGRIPILVCPGADETRRTAALGRLLSCLRTHKLIFLRREGGMTLAGAPISVVDLTRDYDRLQHDQSLGSEQRRILALARHLVFDAVDHRLLISLASPFNLLHELFTISGAGTLLRRGARITCHAALTQVDRHRLKALLEASFERSLAEGFLERPVSCTYIEESYRGAALVVDSPLGGYLTKVAVTREAQGEGIGGDLWARLSEDYPQLVWRARKDNPVAGWYEKLCDGLVRQGNWTVYFRGLPTERIPEAVAYALAQPVDFADPVGS